MQTCTKGQALILMEYRNLFETGKQGSMLQSTVMLGFFGAVFGGAIAAIDNSYKVSTGLQTGTDAVTNIAKETIGSGVSAATAAATMAALGIGGLIGLAGFTAVATITKGFVDSILNCPKEVGIEKGS
jgi:hypothetical protein